MRRYELMVLLDPDVEEKTVAPSLDQFLGVVRQDGGTVDKVDVWGRRRLAYEIAKKTEESRDVLVDSSKEVMDRGKELFDRGRELADEAADIFERGRKLVRG